MNNITSIDTTTSLDSQILSELDYEPFIKCEFKENATYKYKILFFIRWQSRTKLPACQNEASWLLRCNYCTETIIICDETQAFSPREF